MLPLDIEQMKLSASALAWCLALFVVGVLGLFFLYRQDKESYVSEKERRIRLVVSAVGWFLVAISGVLAWWVINQS